jgi:hypothetical protein
MLPARATYRVLTFPTGQKLAVGPSPINYFIRRINLGAGAMRGVSKSEAYRGTLVTYG